jgi:hypothetical protein
VLERSGLISRHTDAQFRPCRLEVDALDATLDWIGAQRRVWSERFDKLDTLLADLQGGTAPTAPRPASTSTSRPHQRRSRHG